MTSPDDDANLKESLIRLEAKIDVVLGRHESRIEDIARRQGEIVVMQRTNSERITANSMALAECKARNESNSNDVAEVRATIAKRGSAATAWAAVGVAALAVVIEPMLNALFNH